MGKLTEEDLKVLRGLPEKLFIDAYKRIRRYRKPVRWRVVNRALYGIMKVEDIKVNDLADMLEVSERTVQRWIYEGQIPKKHRREKISRIFNMKEDILFNEEEIERRYEVVYNKNNNE